MVAEFWNKESWGSPELICVVDKIQIFLPVLLVAFSLAGPELPRNSVIWGGCVDFCFGKFKTHCDNFCFGFCIFFTSTLFLYYVLTVFFFFNNILRMIIFFFKVTMFLHYLWVGPLQAITVTTLLWMETGISCLAGMAVLIFLLLLQSCFGMWFSSLR